MLFLFYIFPSCRSWSFALIVLYDYFRLSSIPSCFWRILCLWQYGLLVCGLTHLGIEPPYHFWCCLHSLEVFPSWLFITASFMCGVWSMMLQAIIVVQWSHQRPVVHLKAKKRYSCLQITQICSICFTLLKNYPHSYMFLCIQDIYSHRYNNGAGSAREYYSNEQKKQYSGRATGAGGLPIPGMSQPDCLLIQC